MDFPPQLYHARGLAWFSKLLVFIRLQRWTARACLRNPRRWRQRMCNLRVLMALRLLGRIRGCRWMLVEGFGCRWFGNVWECLWFPMIFQSFLQHLWTLGGNSMKMAANLQKHVASCCHLRATRIQRWTARAWSKRPRRLVLKVCNLQLVPTMPLVVKTSLSFYKFHYVPLYSIMFHSFSWCFILFQIVPHDIPSHSSNLDTTWWKLTEHYHTLSTYVHILVLFCFIFWFYSSISSTHPICGLCCDTYELFMDFLEQFEDMCRRFDCEFWIILIL